MSEAAQGLVGHPVGEEASETVAAAIAADAQVIPSSHAGIDYRREMAGVLVAPGPARRLRGRRAAA